jgi:hypothetical protein
VGNGTFGRYSHNPATWSTPWFDQDATQRRPAKLVQSPSTRFLACHETRSHPSRRSLPFPSWSPSDSPASQSLRGVQANSCRRRDKRETAETTLKRAYPANASNFSRSRKERLFLPRSRVSSHAEDGGLKITGCAPQIPGPNMMPSRLHWLHH